MAAMMNVDDAWQTFTAPTGENYYYNWVTLENTWDKPQALVDREARATICNDSTNSAIQPIVGSTGLQSVGYAGFQTSIAGASSVGFGSSGSIGQAVVNKDANSKPVSSHAIPGTPWCVVWTGDHKVFFFNPSIKTSVWERPPELYNRSDVDFLVARPPDKDSDESKDAAAAAAEKQSEEGKDNEKQSEEDADTEEDEEDPTPKRTRKEKKMDHLHKEQKAKKQPVPIKDKPIDPVAQAELQAQQERNKIPLEVRITKFRELLEEKNIGGASIWQKELSRYNFGTRCKVSNRMLSIISFDFSSKIKEAEHISLRNWLQLILQNLRLVFDERYLLLCAAERKAAFEAFTKERSEVERSERRKRVKEARQEYKNLLSEAGLHAKSSFTSFTKKFGKDPRFQALEKSRDREEYFREFVKHK